jgi:hypothetical protein
LLLPLPFSASAASKRSPGPWQCIGSTDSDA